MTAKVTYLGDFRCEAQHLQSGSLILSDAPTDNHGKGEKFSPTDLCAASLAECALTTIAILGKGKTDITGAYCKVTKMMNASPRRIQEIVCEFVFPKQYSEEERNFIEHTAHNCPVALSLHPDLIQTMEFEYPE